MVEITFQDDQAILKFPRHLMTAEFVQDFLAMLQIEMIAEKSQMTEEQAWKLSEEIKEKWWEENKDRILQRIKKR